MVFRHYRDEDYNAVCDFLIALNQSDRTHVNWNWARFEWMAEHPEFDKNLRSSIGLWFENEKIVGAAIYDMYFGEAFCGALPEASALYPAIIEYSYKELKDDSGLGIAICDENSGEIEAAERAGFTKAEQTETVMAIELKEPLPVMMPEGFRIRSLDPVQEPEGFQWLLWQGFDHGNDREACKKEEAPIPQNRVHFDPQLSLTAIADNGEQVSYCCLWYDSKTDFAYVEPVCTIPPCRGKGIAKALIYEALNRARDRGAKTAYVISDTAFYEKLGFRKSSHYTFYWKKG